MTTPSVLNSVHLGSSPLGIHYKEVLRATLATLWRRKLLVTSIVALAIALGGIVVLMTPKQYTAESFVHGGFTSPDLISRIQEHNGANIGFDALQLVETQSRLLQSYQLARQVVERLGLDRLQVGNQVGNNRLFAWLQTKFYGDMLENPEYQKDSTATRLMRDLSVRTEPRVYLIVVSYRARDPKLATLVVNAFVAEFLRSITLQKLFDQRTSANNVLSQALKTFGEKHPKVREARIQLEAADDMLRGESSKELEEILRDAGAKVTLAQADAVPSSPNPRAILAISLLAGLMASVGLAIYLPPSRVARRGSPS